MAAVATFRLWSTPPCQLGHRLCVVLFTSTTPKANTVSKSCLSVSTTMQASPSCQRPSCSRTRGGMRWGSRRGLTRSMWTTGQNAALSSLARVSKLMGRVPTRLLGQTTWRSTRHRGRKHGFSFCIRIRMMRSVLLRQCLQRCILRLRRLRRLPAAQLQRVSGFVFFASFFFLSNTPLSLRCSHRCPLVHACSICAPRQFTFFVFNSFRTERDHRCVYFLRRFFFFFQTLFSTFRAHYFVLYSYPSVLPSCRAAAVP